MDKTAIYIQKLIVLLLVCLAGVYLFPLIKLYYLIPALFFTLAFLVSRITGQKPDFLFGLERSEDFVNKKSGFWLLLKWIIILFGLVYDLFAWTIFGVYILFTIILDFILLIKTLIYWVIHAIIWYLKLFFFFFVFVFKMLIYYVFRWSWWIYKISFNNIRKSINLNFYIISLYGSVLMLFLILLFYGVGILMGTPEIIFVGAIFSLLPLVWSYGEISALRLRKAENESYPQVKSRFNSGFDAVRAVLGYFIIFLLLAIVELFFNIMGWIPQVGFSFMGLALNINTLASLILLFVFVILIFSKMIMPPHVVYNKDFRSGINGSIVFLGVIGKRFLRYIISGVPTAIFGAVVIAIPAIIVFLSIVITLNLKNSILDTRISILNQRESSLTGIEKFRNANERERISYYKSFPKNTIKEFRGLKSLNSTIRSLKENIAEGEKEISSLTTEFTAGIDSLNRKIDAIKSRPMADSASTALQAEMEALKQNRLTGFSKWKEEGEYSISKMKVDLSDKKGLMIQLPVVFLLTIIWLSFFAGLVLAFLVSYLGNVYFELYNFREDGKPVYFRQVISELNAADRNQPLLGFTLILLGLIPWVFAAAIIKFLRTLIF